MKLRFVCLILSGFFGVFGFIHHIFDQPYPESLIVLEEVDVGAYFAAEIEPDSPEPTTVPVDETHSGRDLYNFYIDQICEQYYPNIPVSLMRAVVETESHYQPDVLSSAGAVGLAQLIPKYHQHRAEKYHLNDLWDPYTNLIACADLLNELYLTKGNWRDALYGYNHHWGYVDYVLSLQSTM